MSEFLALFFIIIPFALFFGCLLFYYLIVIFGFNFLGIRNVERQKIVVFIFFIVIYGIFDPVVNLLHEIIQAKFLYIINYLISSCFIFFLLKYYFNLTGKKLWKFFIYFIFVDLIIYLSILILAKL